MLKTLSKVIFIVSSIILLFSGCGSKTLTYVHDKNIKVGSNLISTPELNIVHTEEVGSNMYYKANLYMQDTKDVIIMESINTYSQASGKFIKEKGYIGLLSEDNKTKWKGVCSLPDNNNNPYTVCLFDSKNNSTFDKVGSLINSLYADLNPSVPYTLTNTESKLHQDSFKYVALYQGKKGDSIKISFREFKNDMARPAFTQDIEYELNNDGTTIIGFKGLRIEILKATNMNITYKVIKDYN